MAQKNNRIIFLDILRAIAVLMMVQGHTIDTFLADVYRSSDSLPYSVWEFLRGFTAPVFMFISGTVFAYLLYNAHVDDEKNPRIIKGIKRFALLVGLGYLLRYPTYRIFDFRYVSEKSWSIFFSVDALHLIGFGILFIVIIYYLNEKLFDHPYGLMIMGAIFFIFLHPIMKVFDFSYLPDFIAPYLNNRTGSIFPLFPWAGYVISGAVFGIYLSKHPGIHLHSKLGVYLLKASGILLGSSVVLYLVKYYLLMPTNFFVAGVPLTIFRLGVVVLFSGILALFANKLENTPEIVKVIGRNTLPIYVLHLIILYGSAWNPGFYKYLGHSLSVGMTILAAILMLVLMILFALLYEKVKLRIRSKIKR